MSIENVISFKRAPAINRSKKLDVLMAYPMPTLDSPFSLTPLSILFPGKMFEDQNLRVEYWDQRFDSWEMLEDLMRDTAQVAVSCFTGHQCSYAADILIRAKQINPRMINHVGGHHARLCTEDVTREPFVDQVWPERSYHEHSFPFSDAAKRLWVRGDLQYVTSTGCPYGCQFCALRSAWNPRPLEQLEQEIDALIELTGATELSLCDPNIGFDKWKDEDGKRQSVDRLERMKGLGKIFRKHNLKIDANVRADYLNQEYADTMAWAGITSLEFGLESGDEFYLRKYIKKGHDVQAGLTANACIASTPISVMNSFIMYGPHETKEQQINTMNHIDHIMEINPKARASIYRFTPYPGAPFYDMACAGDGIEKFIPPKTMKEWGSMPLMVDATYWVAGLCFRLDNTQKNFPPEDWHLIEPYVQEAKKLWKERRPEDFKHAEAVEKLISWQIRKHNAQMVA